MAGKRLSLREKDRARVARSTGASSFTGDDGTAILLSTLSSADLSSSSPDCPSYDSSSYDSSSSSYSDSGSSDSGGGGGDCG